MLRMYVCIFISISIYLQGEVKVGLDVFFQENIWQKYKGKRIGLIINHTSVDHTLTSSTQRFLEHKDLHLVAIFCPEHGLEGEAHATEKIVSQKNKDIPIYSLHGNSKRPSSKILQDIDVLIYDIQCIGSRSYTYISTLFYIMEEASKNNVKVVVLDRPNPINGITVDGACLEEKLRSFLGYINIPYCHGMTIAELARYFNKEYQINCKLTVIAMQGWKRSMSYMDTGLHWVPPSPNIPEPDTPYYYPSTGILGELQLVSIGIGYTLPFKIMGAPWIDKKKMAKVLNSLHLRGAYFLPFSFKPFFGMHSKKVCQGIKIIITDPKLYQPISVQFAIIGILKSMYPQKFAKALSKKNTSFSKVLANQKIMHIIEQEKFPTWKLLEYKKKDMETFREKRKKYLLLEYL